MKKAYLVSLIFLSIFLLIGCSPKDKNTSSKSVSSSSVEVHNKLKLSKDEYSALMGTWECLDEVSKGDKVYIKRAVEGLIFQYEGEDETETKFSDRSREGEEIYYSFENSNVEMGYMLVLKMNGNIILNRGTTNPEMEGVSKPMEYRRISE